MKVGVVGKGGVGKTTIAALLAQALAEQGRSVVAIDTDSNPNLGLSMGLTLEDTEAVPVLPRSLIVGSAGDMSPHDLVRQYGRPTPAGATLLSAIRVTEAGAGCTCAGHATVRSLLHEALDGTADVTVVDMEAGLEHLSRSGGTLAYADVLLVVMEPSRKSVITAARTAALADELGIAHVYGVGNKARMPDDAAFFTELCESFGVPLAAIVPLDADVAAADRAGGRLAPGSGAAVRAEITRLVEFLDAVPAA